MLLYGLLTVLSEWKRIPCKAAEKADVSSPLSAVYADLYSHLLRRAVCPCAMETHPAYLRSGCTRMTASLIL